MQALQLFFAAETPTPAWTVVQELIDYAPPYDPNFCEKTVSCSVALFCILSDFLDRMLIEKKTHFLYLLSVDFTAEPDMYFSGKASPPCFCWTPSQAGRVERLPCTELSTWWTTIE